MSEMEVLMEEYEDLETNFLKFQKHILNSNKSFPIDYIEGGQMKIKKQ